MSEKDFPQRMLEVNASALREFGQDIQMTVAMEELAELIQAISKYKRAVASGDCLEVEVTEIAVEVADVEICLQQLRLTLDEEDTICDENFSALVNDFKEEAIDNLERRIRWCRSAT